MIDPSSEQKAMIGREDHVDLASFDVSPNVILFGFYSLKWTVLWKSF